MTTSDGKKHVIWDTVVPILLCVCFIASSMLFLVQMIIKSQEENIDYLYNAAYQEKTSILKQIEGDLQTLDGLAIVLGGMEEAGKEKLMLLLREINDENAFIRMGLAELDGDAWLVNLNGEVYERNLKDMEYRDFPILSAKAAI